MWETVKDKYTTHNNPETFQDQINKIHSTIAKIRPEIIKNELKNWADRMG